MTRDRRVAFLRHSPRSLEGEGRGRMKSQNSGRKWCGARSSRERDENPETMTAPRHGGSNHLLRSGSIDRDTLIRSKLLRKRPHFEFIFPRYVFNDCYEFLMNCLKQTQSIRK